MPMAILFQERLYKMKEKKEGWKKDHQFIPPLERLQSAVFPHKELPFKEKCKNRLGLNSETFSRF